MPEEGAALRGRLLPEDSEEAHARTLSHRGGRGGRAVQPVGVEETHVASGHTYLCHARAARHTLLIRLHLLEDLAPESVRLAAVVSASVSIHLTPLGGR